MSSFSLTDETAIDVLIFWIESSDGSVSYDEQEAVKQVIADMDYTMETFYKTITHLSALSTENLEQVFSEAVDYIKKNFSDDGKERVYNLLGVIANSDGEPGEVSQRKLADFRKEMF